MKKLISLFLVMALSWANTGHAGLDNYQYQINKAKTDAISTAAADATTKANNAQAAAISAAATDATTKANNAQAAAISAAATDATTKANAATAVANAAQSTANTAQTNATYAGIPIQAVYSENTAVSTTTTVMPWDDTIPQVSEGAQVLSAVISPRISTSKLRIRVVFFGSTGSNTLKIVDAIFRDGAANAICAGSQTASPDQNMGQLTLECEVAAGRTAATTFTFRAGPPSAVTLTVNGTSAGSRLFGGVMRSIITVQEIRQ